MIADRTQQSLIATFRFLDDTGNGITSLAWDTAGISIAYKRYGATSWTALTLTEGTLGTYVSSGFVEDSDGNGFYEIGVPDEARVAGHRTLWRFKYAANDYRFDSIDYVAIPSQESSGVNLEFSIPGVEEISTTESEIYVREQGRTITFTANQDVSAIPLVLIFEDGEGVDQYIIEDEAMDKTGGDTVIITLPPGFTETEGSLTWAIRNASTERVYGTGSISITYAPFQG